MTFGVRKLLAGALTLVCLAAPAPTASLAAPAVTLRAALTPERLGQGTTVGFDFRMTAPTGGLPPAVKEVEVRYPANFGVGLSGLGLATCPQATLETFGPAGCLAESRMGLGTALVDIPVGSEMLQERISVTLFRAPEQDGHLMLFFYAEGTSPLIAQITIPSVLLSASWPYGGRIKIDIPAASDLPEAPYLTVVELHATLGPHDITYYEHVKGKTVAYHPKGVLLPDSCPHGGFPFSAAVNFVDGTHARAHTTVPCPRRQRSHH